MSFWSDLKGTVESFFQFGIGGVGLRSNSGSLEVRNAANSARAQLQCSTLNTTGMSIVSNGALQTNGNGSGSVSGNARGTGAVDLQVLRTDATQVASGTYSFVAGRENTAAGLGAVAIGVNCNAAQDYSLALGRGGVTRDISELAFASGGLGGISGTAQIRIRVMRRITNGGVTVPMNAPGTGLVMIDDSSILFKFAIVARNTGSDTESAAWKFEGLAARGAGASTIAIVGSVTKTVIAQNMGAMLWDVNVAADTTNGVININVTGEVSKTINWVAFCEMTEVVG